jgi:hypothetical protein
MNDWPIGTLVAHDDEPVTTSFWGRIAEPTAEEIAYARSSYDGGVGPDHGDVLVQWYDPDAMSGEPPSVHDRSWEHPSNLQVLP